MIASLAFQGALAKNEQGHAVALSAVASLTVAVIAWLIWVPVGRAAAVPGAPFAVVLAADLLGSIFVGGLVGNVIGLLPLRFLSGGTLMAWSRAAWAATFGIAVFGLVEVELRPQSTSAHPGSAPVVTAVPLFVLFGGSSAGMRDALVLQPTGTAEARGGEDGARGGPGRGASRAGDRHVT